MIIDAQKFQIFNKLEQASNSNVIDAAIVDSQVQLLKSENVSLAVIKRFDLANDPEFVGRSSNLSRR